MAYNKQKLLRFKEAILKEADFKIIELKKNSLNAEKIEIETSKNRKLNEIFIDMQKSIKEIKYDFEKKFSKKVLELKNEILIFRNSLIENFKKTCRKEIEKFTQTSEYENYLIEKIKKSCNNLNLTKAKLKLKRLDLKFKDKISNLLNFETIEADDSIKMGGFKIVLEEQKILIDETLTNSLEKSFKNFNKNYELALNFYDNNFS